MKLMLAMTLIFSGMSSWARTEAVTCSMEKGEDQYTVLIMTTDHNRAITQLLKNDEMMEEFYKDLLPLHTGNRALCRLRINGVAQLEAIPSSERLHRVRVGGSHFGLDGYLEFKGRDCSINWDTISEFCIY